MSRSALTIGWASQPYADHNNASLGRMLGCSENTVAGYRAYYAPETTSPRGRPRTVDLSRADFTRRDTEIARRHGCCTDVVRGWRRTHDVPACTVPRGGDSTGRPRLYDRRRFNPRKTAAWNAKAMGCSYQLAWLMLKEHKQKKGIKP